MLKKLYVQNFALIEQLTLEPGPGMNVLTGETGAGKSILVGALGLVMGRRADVSVMFNAEQKCVVEAAFQPINPAPTKRLFDKHELDWETEIIIRREISKSGKSRAFINDTPVTLPVLKEISSGLIELHGQHEGQLLMDSAAQLRILDQFAGLQKETESFSELLNAARKLDAEIRKLEKQEKEGAQQLDYLSFQAKELQEAEISVQEENEIERDFKVLQNAEEIGETITRNVFLLSEAEPSVAEQLGAALRELEKSAALMPEIKTEADKINEAVVLLNDATLGLQQLLEDVEHDPRKLEYLNERLNTYNKLKVKFNVKTAEELLALQHDFETQIAAFDSIEETIRDKKRELETVLADLGEAGLEIEAARKEAAANLESQVTALLKEVGLTKASFRIDLNRLHDSKGLLELDGKRVQPSASGVNYAEFMIQTNVGAPWSPLAQTASGGEISRVMLAIKSALAERMQLSALVFDEIDTGVSGEVAMKVGRVMERLAEKHQVITITHLPQIASRGQSHFYIYKEVRDERTTSHVKPLSEQERVDEIAKIMSGENPTEHALQSAKELLAK